MADRNVLIMTNPALSRTRIAGIDMARAVALLAMAIYHFCWDLDFFGFAEIDVAFSPAGRAASTAIAGTFLALAGISLVLAHGDGIRWPSFLRRLGQLVLAAAAISAVTTLVTPEGAIYFGILHCIAAASLIGLLFLRLPWFVTAAAAAACLIAPHLLATPALNGPGWMWLGLGTVPPRTNDYEPLLPWAGFLLAGMALARVLPPRRWPAVAAAGRLPGLLARLGRHSLLFYLLHQPVLYGATWAAALAFHPAPRQEESGATAFREQCLSACVGGGSSGQDCSNYCTCVGEASRLDGIWPALIANRLDAQGRQKLDRIIGVCSR